METPAQPHPMENSPTGQPAKKSTWTVIVEVFAAPTQAFQTIRDNPRILVPLILLVILIGAASALTTQHSSEMQYEMLRKSSLPPEAIDSMRESAENPNVLMAALGGPIALIILGLLEALLAMFIGNVIFAGKAGFKGVWSVALLSSLIVGLGQLIRVPLVYAKDTMLVSIGPAALLPGKDMTSLLYGFLYYADLFAIWAVIVAGFGYAAVFGLSTGKGMAISIINFVIFTCILLGMSLIGLMFAGVEFSLI